MMATPGVALSDGDRTFLRWLAQRVQSAAEVLDDINSAQIFYGRLDDVKRDVVRTALTNAILEDAARLVGDLDKLGKGDLVSGKPHLAAVGKDGA